MDHVHCNLCGADNPVPYITTNDRFSGKIFTLSICGNCNLVYLTPQPTLPELGEYYPDDYEAYFVPEQPELVRANHGVAMVLSKQLDFVERFHSSPGYLLDVGCATGNFINYARMKGWQVIGIEVMDKAVKVAREHYHLEVSSTDLESANLLPSSIEVVTLWDVLEHLPNPRSAMKKIHEILKPSGMFFFSIPNLDSFDRKLFGSEWIGWDPPRHFTLFDQVSIKQLLSEAGFKIINQQCLTGGKGTFFLSLDRIIKKKPSYGWARHLYPFISIFLWPYRKISYLSLRGPIMYYAAQKV